MSVFANVTAVGRFSLTNEFPHRKSRRCCIPFEGYEIVQKKQKMRSVCVIFGRDRTTIQCDKARSTVLARGYKSKLIGDTIFQISLSLSLSLSLSGCIHVEILPVTREKHLLGKYTPGSYPIPFPSRKHDVVSPNSLVTASQGRLMQHYVNGLSY